MMPTNEDNAPDLPGPGSDLTRERRLSTKEQTKWLCVGHHQSSYPLWRGVGLAPHADDMYSGRAEAFGLLAGLIFIQSYLAQ